MQFTIIVAVSAHVGSLLLIGWMTVQLYRHLQRIEQRLAVLELDRNRGSDAGWPAPPPGARRGRTPRPRADERIVRGTRGIA